MVSDEATVKAYLLHGEHSDDLVFTTNDDQIIDIKTLQPSTKIGMCTYAGPDSLTIKPLYGDAIAKGMAVQFVQSGGRTLSGGSDPLFNVIKQIYAGIPVAAAQAALEEFIEHDDAYRERASEISQPYAAAHAEFGGVLGERAQLYLRVKKRVEEAIIRESDAEIERQLGPRQTLEGLLRSYQV